MIKLYSDVYLDSVATEYIGKPDYVISDGWRTAYITVDYTSKTWVRMFDYFKLSQKDLRTINSVIFGRGNDV